jgi:NADH-quinone oxidoreductase subunit L
LLVFFGPRRGGAGVLRPRFSAAMTVPVAVLALLSVIAGFIQVPPAWHGPALVARLLAPVIPATRVAIEGVLADVVSPVVVGLVSLSGIELAYLLFGPAPGGLRARQWPAKARRGFAQLTAAAREGWGFDRLYSAAFVRPFVRLARAARYDVMDLVFTSPAHGAAALNRLLSRSQAGRLRYCLAVASFGVLVFIAIGLLR